VNHMILETSRLIIRPFIRDDLLIIHRILNETFGDPSKAEYLPEAALEERRSWLEWQILNDKWFVKKHQPPYGDRAISLKPTGQLIGSIGYVPCLDSFEQIPDLNSSLQPSVYNTTEFGLFWVIDPKHQRQGYATEAAEAMVEYAFKQLRVKRIIATTEHANVVSQNVMRKIGMRLTRNPLPEPPWLQVVGVLENSGDSNPQPLQGRQNSLLRREP
jgi:ribosomal-protein-alanine N-acetyltransferase